MTTEEEYEDDFVPPEKPRIPDPPCFRALVTFTDETGNVYCAGYVYTADRPHLITMAERFLVEGKVEWVDRHVDARVGGRGHIA